MAHMAKMGVNKDSELDRYPVAVVRPEVVRVQGNVHIPTGRVATRAGVEKRLRRSF